MPTFASFDGLQLSYTVWEGGGRPVLLQHGFAADTNANWIAPGVVDTLQDAGLTVISLDARGHGRSAKPHDEASYGDDAMVRDVSALLDTLNLDEVSMVGYSMGAMIALGAVAADPRIRCLAIGGVGSGIVDFGGVDTRVVTPEAISEALLASDPSTLPPSSAPFRALADALRADRIALAAVARGTANPKLDLTAIAVPTLILAGDTDPLAAEPERLAAAIAGARLVRVPGDHMAAVMHPAFGSALTGFLTAHDL
ncbi:alpha/beta fold hydrolase [Amycolatopsis keratiniphila]|uniref:Alpha/beta hydrolase n=1 Tax=Amycolatopsis keratiniphila subsp. keratiniphila TaxID=227715 RepID=A0A1W2LQ30_9PSEU|nr:alpha/beta hydrolase [Amycolatopsis keratiniphila]OLZ56052.1 alpha/beta hydrolase [Amycolatopsis keratiniphila subsp. nogabecina]ONF66118.1 alpha/beta hydrolase [Amycolatopsis keratiniphila subsp. keratiniphila]SDU51485.1 Lysophospholipase, alpha-beta hydrolase superfamily [Amycolatopsis keratiniphila]